MPLGWVGFAVKGGLILAFVLVILWIFRWIWRAGQDRQILRETQDRLRQEEEARRKEREIREAVDKARSAPGLPACIVEEPKAPGEAVGRFEFAQPWVDSLQAMISQGRATQAAQEAIKCASETAHRLRQATTAIRLNNQPD